MLSCRPMLLPGSCLTSPDTDAQNVLQLKLLYRVGLRPGLVRAQPRRHGTMSVLSSGGRDPYQRMQLG